jgi:hypothetical protein
MKQQFPGLHLDFIGFSASLLCALHCIALPFVVSLAPLAGLRYLENPWLELSLFAGSFLIAAWALLRAYHRHHHNPIALLIVGMGFALIGLGLLLGETGRHTC